jgi:anti-sigma B factor antagonist
VPEQHGIRVWSLGGVPVLTAPDEIDIANADELAEALLAASDGHAVTVADLSETMFCDSSGLNALIQVSVKAASSGAELRLAAASANVLRLLTVTGMDRKLRLFATVPEAVATKSGADGPDDDDGTAGVLARKD